MADLALATPRARRCDVGWRVGREAKKVKFIEKRERKKKRSIDSWNQLIRFFCVKNLVPLNYYWFRCTLQRLLCTCSRFPVPNLTVWVSLWADYESPPPNTNGNTRPISKKKKKNYPKNQKLQPISIVKLLFFVARALSLNNSRRHIDCQKSIAPHVFLLRLQE